MLAVCESASWKHQCSEENFIPVGGLAELSFHYIIILSVLVPCADIRKTNEKRYPITEFWLNNGPLDWKVFLWQILESNEDKALAVNKINTDLVAENKFLSSANKAGKDVMHSSCCNCVCFLCQRYQSNKTQFTVVSFQSDSISTPHALNTKL